MQITSIIGLFHLHCILCQINHNYKHGTHDDFFILTADDVCFIDEAKSMDHFRYKFHAMCEDLEFVILVVHSMLKSQNMSNSIKHCLE